MRDVLRDGSYTRYHFVRLSGVAGEILTAVGDTRTFTGETPHPVVSANCYNSGGSRSGPFALFGDRDVIVVTCSPDAWMSSQLSPITAWDGKTLSVYSIALDGGGSPVADGDGSWNWVVFEGTVQEVVETSGVYTIYVESDNSTPHDAVPWSNVIGVPPLGGDMTKAEFATGGIPGVVDTASEAVNADTVDGFDAVDFDTAGAAASAVLGHEGSFDHADLPTTGEKAALPGTSGVPGAANRYVTDADARNSDARTPTAHTHDGGDISSQVADAAEADLAHEVAWADVTGKPTLITGPLVFPIAKDKSTAHEVGEPLASSPSVFNASSYSGGTSWTFRCVLWVSGPTAPLTARARLYNLTDGEYVTGADVTSTSVSAEEQESTALTVGSSAGNLRDSKKIYEVHFEVTGGAVDVDMAHLGSAELVRS